MVRGQPDYAGTVIGPGMVPASIERRTTLSNDNGITSGEPPEYQSDTSHGKFFPRGMRGMVETIQIYCKGDASDTIILGIAPTPTMGPTHLAVITPTAAWGWQSATFTKMWNYDSMYVMVAACESEVSYGYDEVKPYDCHETDDVGVTYYANDMRIFMRVVMTGKSAGNVPVSGTVNNIPLPNTSSINYYTGVTAPNGAEVTVADIYGAGELQYIFLWWVTAVAPTAVFMYDIYIYIDEQTTALQIYNSLLTQSPTATSGKCDIGAFWQDATQTYMALWLKLPFRRHLKVTAMQLSGGSRALHGWVVPALIK